MNGPTWTPEEWADGIRRADRAFLGRALSLVESTLPEDAARAADLFAALGSPHQSTFRLGITGNPGAGKSTLTEALGMHWTEQGHRVAVLAVDPSSSLHRGSILGDKTRMERLSRHPNAFIRPVASGGQLGGVAAST
ncbi:MAG: methylmalonyl Co-A mutase-associated GTPase MeaB, partial [Schleiferiaceae bacterium]